PAQSELAVAVYEARLIEVTVRIGDEVREGDVLARLTSPDLEAQAEQASLDQLLEQLNAQRALAEGDYAKFEIAEQRGKILALKSEQGARRLEDLVIRAPVTGRIADLIDRSQIGALISSGAVVAEVQKTGEMLATLKVADSDGPLLAKDMTGDILVRGVVDRAYPITLIDNPVAVTQEDGQAILTATVTLEGEAADGLFKGLSGFARIDGGAQPRALNYLRPITNWLSLTLWKYTGWRL
ncbi:MAG: HlyD family efflux transporter periplasmic adaptor subunit, partial [Pseudomonadota bacterium]